MTSTVEIVSTEDLGEITKVVVIITSKEVCSVEDVECDYIDRGTPYHANLHDNYVQHSHNTLKVRRALFFDNPYTKEDLDAHVHSIKQEIDSVNYKDHFYVKQPDTTEVQYTDTGLEKKYHDATNMPEEVTAALRDAFPDLDVQKHIHISTPVYHELLGEEVISTFLYSWCRPDLTDNGQPIVSKSRKYCMTSKKYYDRCYRFTDESFGFLPENTTVFGVGYNTNAQEGLELPDFFDVYFACDPETAESFFGLERKRGGHKTYYAVTVVDDVVVRTKTYCYDELTNLSDWESHYATHKKHLENT